MGCHWNRLDEPVLMTRQKPWLLIDIHPRLEICDNQIMFSYFLQPTGNPQQLQVNKHHSSSVDSTTKLKSSMLALSSGVNSCCSSDILPISPSPEVNRCHQHQQPRQFNNGSTGSASSYTPSVTSQVRTLALVPNPILLTFQYKGSV